ncbi:MAG: hypothetical protein D6786_06045 [Gammaproteobacteria bacterium]|nr:MAG: hypothetical protein D6786_06045 [Gammaproteobacteria bacterium]
MTLLAPAAMAADDDYCKCWYKGYETAIEFPALDLDPRSGSYRDCAREGRGNLFNDGFRAAREGQPEFCPHAPPPPQADSDDGKASTPPPAAPEGRIAPLPGSGD